MRQLLSALGYDSVDDAIEFVMAGLALIPTLMFLSGNVIGGAVCLVVLILVLALLGARTPSPPVPPRADSDQKERKPPG